MSTRKRGRPEVLDSHSIQKIAELVAAGVPVESAAATVRCSSSSYYSYMARGREIRETGLKPRTKRDRLALELLEAIEKAVGDAEARMVLTVVKASADKWQAAAWWLERKYPDRWGRRDRDDVTAALGSAVDNLARVISAAPSLPDEEAAA